MNLNLSKNKYSFFSPTATLPVLGIIGGAVLGAVISPKMALLGSLAGFFIMLYIGFKEENADVLAQYKNDILNKILIAEVEGRKTTVAEPQSESQLILNEVLTLSVKEAELEDVISKLREQLLLQGAKHDIEVERLKNEIMRLIYYISFHENTSKSENSGIHTPEMVAYTMSPWDNIANRVPHKYKYSIQENIRTSNSHESLVSITVSSGNVNNSLVLDRGATAYLTGAIPTKLAHYPESSFKWHRDEEAMRFDEWRYARSNSYIVRNRYAIGATKEDLERSARAVFNDFKNR